MPEFNLAIRGGTIVTAADSYRADIGVRDGRIVAISEKIEGAAREIDASGLLVLPFVDGFSPWESSPEEKKNEGERRSKIKK